MAGAAVELRSLLALVLGEVAGVQICGTRLTAEAPFMPARPCLGHLLGKVHSIVADGTPSSRHNSLVFVPGNILFSFLWCARQYRRYPRCFLRFADVVTPKYFSCSAQRQLLKSASLKLQLALLLKRAALRSLSSVQLKCIWFCFPSDLRVW